MKKAILTTILGLFLICGVKAQNTVTMPTFTGKDVVLKVQENYPSGWMQASDGILDTYFVGFEGNTKNPADIPNLLATAITQLRNQGFKIITSNSRTWGETNGTALTYYIFQKD